MKIDALFRPFRILANKVMPKKYLADFNWSTYTSFDYEPQITGLVNGGNELILSNAQVPQFKDFRGEISDVHAPHILLYKTCLSLQPNSIFEVGAGAGYHLINLSKLMPKALISGIDLLPSQVELGLKLFPEHKNLLQGITFGDFTKQSTCSSLSLSPDIVFTQAVTMHLPFNKAKKMVVNMINLAQKNVILVENVKASHNYKDLLDGLISNGLKFDYEILKISNNENGLILITKTS
jgi:hypothetical protein